MSPRICFLILTLSLTSRAQDFLYESALSLLEDYNSQTTNLTLVQSLLLESAASGNPSALSKLGEFHLFGFPISPDNSAYQVSFRPDFINSEGKFRRDFRKAIDYFRKAMDLGGKDAFFYMTFILHQSLLLPEFSQLMEEDESLVRDWMFLSYVNSGLQFNSKLTQRNVVTGHLQCMEAFEIDLPDFLTNETETLPFHKSPYFSEWNGCFGPCDVVVFSALELASEAVRHYQEKGGVMNYDIGPVQDVLEDLANSETDYAVKFLKREAEDGNQEAAAALADNYLFGNTGAGINRDPGEAFRYYVQAAEDGNVLAMQNLGVLYLQGIGGEKNATLALKYLLLAAEKGSISAYNGLGYIYQHGFGVPANSSKAFEYFKIAADSGYVESQSNLGVLYLYGDGVTQSFEKAYEYFSKAAKMGHLPATFNLGIMHLNGYGKEKSCEIAMDLFDSVSKHGATGKILQQGYFFFKYGDMEGAYLSFALAASLGYESGQLSAGYMWEKGLVPFECKKGKEFCAASYYAMAVYQSEDPLAYYRLGDISYYGSEAIPINYEDALKMYELGIELPESLFNIGYMHEHGLGVAQDLDEARRIYSQIITNAEDSPTDSDAKYPAYLSLLFLQLKTAFSSLSPFFSLF